MAKARVVREIENPHSTGEDFTSLLQEANQNQPKEGDVVKGLVVGIEKDNVIIDIGYKCEGRVPLREFPMSERDGIKVGDEVEVYLERIENSKAEAVISREKAVREESWIRLEKFHNSGETVKGIIFGRVKGGFTVDLDGAIAFLPGSQVDVRPVKDISPLMGIPQPFQILKMDRKRGNIVVSRRSIMEESRSAERAEALSGIEEGQIVEGTVKNITDYGAFIDLGVIDGLLHVTDISWKRISHPSEVLALNQKIKCKIIKYDKTAQRISLGLKQMEESPWDGADGRFPIGTKQKGTVTNVADYGVFVELAPGIEGLVHVSEMSWSKKGVNPNKLVSSGQEVEVMVLGIDANKQRLSLGIKQCEPNPWQHFLEKHPIGSAVEGEIKNINEHGIFVQLPDNTDGLVHMQDISWDEDSKEAIKKYNKGDKINVSILDVDSEKEKIALGIKQLSGDPFEEALEGFKKGGIATFIVAAVQESGIEVRVGESGISSFIKRNDLARERIECRPERFSVGDKVDAKVMGVDKATRTLKLSIKALEMDEQKEAIATFGSADSGATLGGILGVALDSAKKEAAEKSKKKSSKATAEDSAEEKPAKASKKKKAAAEE